MTSIRAKAYEQLEPSAWPESGLSPFNRLITVAILFSVAMAIGESEIEIASGNETVFAVLEIAVGLLFLTEYLARVWSSAENPKYSGGLRGMVRYVFSPAAILDLLALAPFFIAAVGAEAYLFRLFRLVRVLRLAKLGRYSQALSAIGEAVRSRRYELVTSVYIAALLLLVASTLMYLVEGGLQPETFGSIPRAMWWAIATLTTVGYGDVYPLTVPGRMLAGITAITGIGLIAMPTGILASAFSDAMQRRRASKNHDD